jgi:deazaflavin-dependent oxidoreductase (nitroreductase family)
MKQTGGPGPDYRRSNWFILHIANPMLRFFAGSLGFGTGGIRILEVKGRKSGKWYSIPIRLLELNNRKYLVALQGETFWVKNLRAQSNGRLKLGRQITVFKAVELVNQDKLPILRAYMKRWWSVSKPLTTITSPEAPDEEFIRAEPLHPVFEIS